MFLCNNESTWRWRETLLQIKETKEGLILEIFVKPRSNQFRIVVEGDEIVVYCLEEPVKGKVNKELIKNLSSLFRRKVELVSGFASRQKRLLIRDAEKSEIEGILMSQ
jgi:uncharacterized protein (TIGR00251 family)